MSEPATPVEPPTPLPPPPTPEDPSNVAGFVGGFSSQIGSNFSISDAKIGDIDASIDQRVQVVVRDNATFTLESKVPNPEDVDPTDEYKTNFRKAEELQEEEQSQFEAIRTSLEENRLLLVSGAEVWILDLITDLLMQHPIFAQCNRRFFDETIYSVSCDFHQLTNYRKHSKEAPERLILLRLSASSPVLSTLTKLRIGQERNFTEHLAARKCRVICRIMEAGYTNNNAITHWRIDYLKYALAKHFSREEASKIREQLLTQWREGRWAIFQSEDEFLQNISKILQGPDCAEVLKQQIARTEAQSGEAYVTKPREAVSSRHRLARRSRQRVGGGATSESPGRSRPGVSLLDRDPMSRAVLFGGAYLPELSLQEFETALNILVGDDTMPADASHKSETPPKALSKCWKEEGDLYLRECQLQLSSASNEPRVLEFTTPVRPWLMREFEQALPRYTLECWHRLLTSGWFFEENLSSTAQRNLLRLVIRATHFAPETFGKNLLFAVLQGLEEYVRTLEQQGQSEVAHGLENGLRTAEDLSSLVGTIFRRKAFWDELARKKIQHIYRRLAQLCRAMLEESRAISVEDFFQGLLAIRQFGPILEIGEQLRDLSSFDYMAWVRRVLDSSPASRTANTDENVRPALVARAKIYEWLDYQMVSSDERAIELLAIIRTWRPPAEKDPAYFSYSECYALIFPLRFATATCRTEQAASAESLNPAPSNAQLKLWLGFGGLSSSLVVRQEIEQWGDWLCWPGLGAAAKLHGLDNVVGRIQKGRPNRNKALHGLKWEAIRRGVAPPAKEDLETWETFLRAVSAMADEEDLEAFQIAESLQSWATAVVSFSGEAQAAPQAILDQLIQSASLRLKQRRTLLVKVDGVWSDTMERLLEEIKRIEPSRSNALVRCHLKGLRGITYQVQKSFRKHAAKETGAALSSATHEG